MKRYFVKLSEEEKKDLHALTLTRALAAYASFGGRRDADAGRRRAHRRRDSPSPGWKREHRRTSEKALSCGGRVGGGAFGETQARCEAQARWASRSISGGLGLKRSSRRQKALEYAAVGRQTCGA